jgi:hypothetical protein
MRLIPFVQMIFLQKTALVSLRRTKTSAQAKNPCTSALAPYRLVSLATSTQGGSEKQAPPLGELAAQRPKGVQLPVFNA